MVLSSFLVNHFIDIQDEVIWKFEVAQLLVKSTSKNVIRRRCFCQVENSLGEFLVLNADIGFELIVDVANDFGNCVRWLSR